MSENYVDIMIQSLKKKEQVLQAIISENIKQREILEDTEGDADAFDATVETKAKHIDQIDQLDSGFQKLFDRVKAEIDSNKDSYSDKIKEIQKYIRSVTDLSVEIQTQEARNKDLMIEKFSEIKSQARNIRVSNAAASKYYQSMSKVNLIDPQFMDDKQ